MALNNDKVSKTTAGSTSPVVRVRDGAVYANSRDVAEYFGKRHDHVLRDIRGLSEHLAPQNWGLWFTTTEYEGKTGFGIRRYATIDMTKDGFTLLVMGCTGREALAFKVAYINRFNEMEATLRTPPTAQAWEPHDAGGWVDLEAGLIHRRADSAVETKKRRPPVRIPDHLMPFLRRWRQKDEQAGEPRV